LVTHGDVWSVAVTLSSAMRTGGFELGSSALTSSALKWLHRIQCGSKGNYDNNLLVKSLPNRIDVLNVMIKDD
jgi:hypothetical protein